MTNSVEALEGEAPFKLRSACDNEKGCFAANNSITGTEPWLQPHSGHIRSSTGPKRTSVAERSSLLNSCENLSPAVLNDKPELTENID